MSRVKREADSQITKDQDDDGNEEEATGSWNKAPEDELATRRKVKAKLVPSTKSTSTDKPNPFAAVSLLVANTAGSSGMTSSNPFASLSAVSALSTASNAAAMHGTNGTTATTAAATAALVVDSSESSKGTTGFGAYAKINPFATSGSSFLMDSSISTPSGMTFASTPFTTTSSILDKKDVTSLWGTLVSKAPERGREVITTTIGEMKKEDEGDAPEDLEENDDPNYDPQTYEAPISIPVGSEPLFKPMVGDPGNGEEDERCSYQVRAKLFRLDDKIKGSEEDGKEATRQVKEQEWIEVGKGPVRVLESKSVATKVSRVVMRREKEVGGSGTKVLLNLRLDKLVKVVKQSANISRITCVDASSGSSSAPLIASYLLKTKLAPETDMLIESITTLIDAIDDQYVELGRKAQKDDAEVGASFEAAVVESSSSPGVVCSPPISPPLMRQMS